MSWVMLLSKKRGRERDGDVFLFSKMIKFQNIKVWERWVVVCVIEIGRAHV